MSAQAAASFVAVGVSGFWQCRRALRWAACAARADVRITEGQQTSAERRRSAGHAKRRACEAQGCEAQGRDEAKLLAARGDDPIRRSGAPRASHRRERPVAGLTASGQSRAACRCAGGAPLIDIRSQVSGGFAENETGSPCRVSTESGTEFSALGRRNGALDTHSEFDSRHRDWLK